MDSLKLFFYPFLRQLRNLVDFVEFFDNGYGAGGSNYGIEWDNFLFSGCDLASIRGTSPYYFVL